MIEEDEAMLGQARRAVPAGGGLAAQWLTARTSPALERTLTGHGDGVRAVAVTPDGRRAISASDDRTLKVWDLATGQELASIALEAPMQCVALAPDGVTLVAGDEAGNVYCLCYQESTTDAGRSNGLEVPSALV